MIERWFGLGCVLALIGASMAMNAMFYYGEGRSQAEGFIFAVVSVAADGLKAVLPLRLLVLWLERRWLRFAGGVALESLLIVFALIAALGFAVGSRDQVAETRDARKAEVEARRREVARLEDELRQLPQSRPAVVLEQELRRLSLDPLWSRSKECREATVAASRTFCAGHAQLLAEQAAALERARLSGELKVAQSHLFTSTGARGETGGGLLEKLIARLTGLAVAAVHDLWMLGFALLVELGSSLGLLFFAPRKRLRIIAGGEPGPDAVVPRPAVRRRIGLVQTWGEQAPEPEADGAGDATARR